MTVVEYKTCWKCQYLPEYDVKDRVRKQLSGNDDLLELFKREAESCEFYVLNINDLYRQQLEQRQKAVLEVQTH
jgi:hypothetical protein